MDWSGVDYLWIIVMFLSAVWTLILTAPIHCGGSIGEQVMLYYYFSKSDKETNSSTSWIIWRWVNFQEIFFYGWTISLRLINSLCYDWLMQLHAKLLIQYSLYCFILQWKPVCGTLFCDRIKKQYFYFILNINITRKDQGFIYLFFHGWPPLMLIS